MKNILAKFLSDRFGNFGMTFSLLTIPLIGAGGIALDISMAYHKADEIQAAADAAVLAASASGETDPERLSEIAETNFRLRMTEQFGAVTDIANLNVAVDRTITLTAQANLPLTISSIIHDGSLTIGILSQAKPGGQDKAEIALVLDNTYSMSGQKIVDLKDAANRLLDVFEAQDPQHRAIRVSLVPFSSHVNVGTQNRTQTWITVPADTSEPARYCYKDTPIIDKIGCRMETATGYADGIPYSYQYEVCQQYVYGEPKDVCIDYTAESRWYGCVGSRDHPWNTKDADPSRRYTGLMNTWCSSPVQPLTFDFDLLRHSIANMWPNNETFIQPGIIWGMNTLSPGQPFTEADDFDSGTKKYMIVMTDGTNTISPTYPEHWASDTATSDELMLKTCENAKEAGITVFTVAVGISNSSTEETLAACASSPDKAIAVEDSATLATVFEQIGSQILATRLTR